MRRFLGVLMLLLGISLPGLAFWISRRPRPGVDRLILVDGLPECEAGELADGREPYDPEHYRRHLERRKR